jgi:hypothetical protein
MSQLNVNNTDDLFKRASEEYPLRTDSSDWNKLAAALERDPSLILPPYSEGEDKRRRKRFFWLFFLLPLGGLGYYAWHTRTAAPVTVAVGKPAGKSTEKPAATSAENVGGTGSVGTAIADNGARGADATRTGATGTGATRKGATEVAKTGASTTRTGATGVPTTGTSATGSADHANAGSAKQLSNSTPKAGLFYGVRGKSSSSSEVDAYHKSYSGTAGKNPGGVPNADVAKETGSPKGAAPVKDLAGNGGSVPAGNPRKDTSARKDLTSVKVQVLQKDSTAQKPAAVAKAKAKGKNQHYFYTGILVAPDLSTVKFQSVKGMGYTTGILVGYSFGPRWSIETGAYLDMKKYYTDGQYFSKKKIQALWGLDIQNVDGSCNMIEIPLNARYNLNTSEKRKWFVTTGLATYLMYKEQYNFQILSSSGYSWSNPHTYHNPSQSWFSQISLSMGYEQKLGKVGNLRLEPYLRIPLAGIGTGSLPITSAGLNIGLTHSFR